MRKSNIKSVDYLTLLGDIFGEVPGAEEYAAIDIQELARKIIATMSPVLLDSRRFSAEQDKVDLDLAMRRLFEALSLGKRPGYAPSESELRVLGRSDQAKYRRRREPEFVIRKILGLAFKHAVATPTEELTPIDLYAEARRRLNIGDLRACDLTRVREMAGVLRFERRNELISRRDANAAAFVERLIAVRERTGHDALSPGCLVEHYFEALLGGGDAWEIGRNVVPDVEITCRFLQKADNFYFGINDHFIRAMGLIRWPPRPVICRQDGGRPRLQRVNVFELLGALTAASFLGSEPALSLREHLSESVIALSQAGAHILLANGPREAGGRYAANFITAIATFEKVARAGNAKAIFRPWYGSPPRWYREGWTQAWMKQANEKILADSRSLVQSGSFIATTRRFSLVEPLLHQTGDKPYSAPSPSSTPNASSMTDWIRAPDGATEVT